VCLRTLASSRIPRYDLGRQNPSFLRWFCHSRKLRVLRTDNGGEFTAAEFTSYCANEGVQRHYSARYSPQQNDVVERRNQTIVGMARALLKQRGMPAVF
jgi:transposase InsO family protein